MLLEWQTAGFFIESGKRWWVPYCKYLTRRVVEIFSSLGVRVTSSTVTAPRIGTSSNGHSVNAFGVVSFFIGRYLA